MFARHHSNNTPFPLYCFHHHYKCPCYPNVRYFDLSIQATLVTRPNSTKISNVVVVIKVRRWQVYHLYKNLIFAQECIFHNHWLQTMASSSLAICPASLSSLPINITCNLHSWIIITISSSSANKNFLNVPWC